MSSSNYLWWQTGVVYQIYPRSFQDTTGNGVGDIPGVIQHLDYLRDTLGVHALWLSPFYPSPMADFGYDVSDYTGVDPLFGTLGDFDRLLAEAHRRDLKIIIDFVPNHSSDQHPWFIESRSSRNNPKRDWYVWRDPKPDGSPPNNWLSVFGGGAWEFDEATGQYYLHSFLKEQPDLNWRNPEVEAAMFAALRFWLDRGVDGFRIDVAHAIMKDPELRDNPPNPDPSSAFHKPMGQYDTQLHIHDKGHPDIHPLYQRIRALFDSYSVSSPRVTIGEMHIYDWNKWVRYYGEKLDEVHMPFNFDLLNAKWTAASVRASVDALEAALPQGAWPNFVLGNHDETRIATRLGGQAQARMAAVLLLTLRGTPTLYYGDELGVPEVKVPPDKLQDPWGMRSLPELSRDGCRTPMAWSKAENAGFSRAEPWLPLHDDWRERNVERQLADPASMLSLCRRMLAFRNESLALQHGSYEPLSDVPDNCYVYLRREGQESVLVAHNFSAESRRVKLPSPGTLVLSSGATPTTGAKGASVSELVLGALESVVVKLS